MSNQDTSKPSNFIHQIIDQDIASQLNDGKVVTRFPPEPNGYLHIGHAKSICLNFGTAEKYNGVCHLRFDDTNPEKESQEYIDAIQRDVTWLGYQWEGEVRYTSSYFQQLYDWAVHLIKEGKAYVCDLGPEEAREYRGDFTTPGKDSPFRDRSVEENLSLFERMKAGEFAEGHCSLRAKIDMQSPNMNLRDPMIYRILHVSHHQTGSDWCIYPIYDFAHGQSDAIEGITHSICTLEFEVHRPLYEWFIENLPVPCKPKQREFARLELNYTVTSKRKLKQLVDEGVVDGWDDPRMPTISGMRRRGYTPAAIRNFCEMIGVTRSNGVVDVGMLESALRDDFEQNAERAMCVINPLKVTISNFPAGEVEMLSQPRHPKKDLGQRQLPFSRELYIEREDFSEDTTLSKKQFKRLVLGEFVRLRGGYVIKAEQAIKDDSGEQVKVVASLVPGTVGENPPPESKPRGVIHWVSIEHAVPCELRLYDRLFTEASPDRDKTRSFMELVNPDSLVVVEKAFAEPSLAAAVPESHYQFERTGYFVVDLDSSADKLIINRTLGLKDNWSKK